MPIIRPVKRRRPWVANPALAGGVTVAVPEPIVARASSPSVRRPAVGRAVVLSGPVVIVPAPRPILARVARGVPRHLGNALCFWPGQAAGQPAAVTPYDLLEAVTAAMKADGTVSGLLTGGIFGGFAPPRAVPPFAVILMVGESPAFSSLDNFGSYPFIDRSQIQISVYASNSMWIARNIGFSVERLLNDDAALLFTSGYLMNFRRSMRLATAEEDPFRDGSYIYVQHLTFDAEVGRVI